MPDIKKVFKGDIAYDSETLEKYSSDASLFQIKPEAVVFPKDVDEVKDLVNFVRNNKKNFSKLSLTARSAGTDMTGGPLNESIIVDFTKYFNRIKKVGRDYAVVEPGAYYRDFEKQTLKKGLFLPSYPASREICALGGMIANNSGGEKTLHYGKTEKYVRELHVVLSDGGEYIFKKLNSKELTQKKKQKNFEGKVYREICALIEKNYEKIQAARPKVSKNSAGYALWNVWDKKNFDMTQLFVGSQGTLGIITEATLELVKQRKHNRVAVLYLKSIKPLPDIVRTVLPLDPESLETFDKNTLKLAIQFLPSIAKRVKSENLFTLLLKFLPDAFIQLRMGGLAELVILVQFAGDKEEKVERKMDQFEKMLKRFPVFYRILHGAEAEKYWVMRRESFNLLRHRVKDKQTAPFVDDFIVLPDRIPEVLPKIYAILDKYKIHATLAGHAGSGNFHIIPLMDLSKEEERKKIPEVADKVYDVILDHGGSITAEHNDGLIRSPYLEKMYGREIYRLFEKVKRIFDPLGIFNPGKKVNADLNYALSHIKKE